MATQDCQPNPSSHDRPSQGDVFLMLARAIERAKFARDESVTRDQLITLILHWAALEAVRMGFPDEAHRFIVIARPCVPEDSLKFFDGLNARLDPLPQEHQR